MDFLLVTVLSFGIFVGYNAQPAGNLNFACRNEEEYDMCRSPCEPTCESIKSGIRRNCTQSCVAGCFCREGLVRATTDRSCILPEECNTRIRPICKENEEFRDCGSPCVVNCSNINDPIFCTKPCHSGCFCKQDFVRDSKENCVHPRDCYTAGHKKCPANEHYVDCINFCNTCWENNECRNHYCTPGCDCKPGFFRNFYGQCLSAEECFYDSPYPSFRGYCGENEIYTDCVNLCNDCVFRGRCNFEYYCEPGCDCKSGYVRNDRGICVPEQFCFRKRPICPHDEQYYSCIPTCRATCDTYSDSRTICDTSCTPGCFCKGGLIRRNDGKCVSPRDCPARNPTCPSGEAFYQCLPTCRTTCETLNAASGVCPIECRPGCFCQPGFIRNNNGRCIRPGDCQDYTTPENVPIEGRRGGADSEGITDPTETTSDITTENNQSATDKPPQNDSSVPSSSFPATTMLTTFMVTNRVTAATDPVTSATDLTSAGVDPVTSATDLASATAAPVTSTTDLTSSVTNAITASNTNMRDIFTLSESTTVTESSTIPSTNTQAVETTTGAQTITKKTNDEQITMTTDTSSDATDSENNLSVITTERP